MTKLTYDPYLLYRSGLLRIVKMQIDDTLILTDNNFPSNEEKAIKIAKLMTKNCEYLTCAQPIKFHAPQIKLDSNNIVLIKESHINSIFLVIDHDIDSTNSKGITRKKVSPKE